MKRRLNILCAIVLLVMSWSVLSTLYYMGLGASAGLQAALKGGPTKEKMANINAVGLVPKQLENVNIWLSLDSVQNEKTEQQVPVVYTGMVVFTDTAADTWEKVLSSVIGLLIPLILVGAVVLFIQLIIAINRSDIFNWRNVRRLRWLGILLIVAFGCSLFSEYLLLENLREVLSIPGYELTFSEASRITNLVLGLCSLIVGEVFAIGLKLKEEQDLTI